MSEEKADPPERPGSKHNSLHRGKPLRRRKPMAQRPKRKKARVDIAGLETTPAYWKLKARVLARPLNGRCERCGERKATDAHHRRLVSQGGPDLASNLAALCRQCHDWCHDHPTEARGGGWIVGAGVDWRTKALLLWDGSLVILDDDAGYAFQGYP